MRGIVPASSPATVFEDRSFRYHHPASSVKGNLPGAALPDGGRTRVPACFSGRPGRLGY
jgi:hypothetical protein